MSGAAEPLRHSGNIWLGEARLASFCHSISIYTSIYCHLWRDIVVCKLKKHYNRQNKCGDIFVWGRFSYSEIRVTQMASLAFRFYQFQLPLGELTTFPQTVYSAGEGDTPPYSPPLSTPSVFIIEQNLNGISAVMLVVMS